MSERLDEVLGRTTIFRRLSAEDRQRIAALASERRFAKGEYLFREGDPPDELYTIVSGRVKIVKGTAKGTEIILEIFGPGDPLGAVAVYESRPYPASAVALEPAACVAVPSGAFFALLERHPTLVRGLLTGLTYRLVELTNRLAEVSTGRVDARLARFLLKLGETAGQSTADGLFIPLALSRQELADMIGTTIETAIRIMSRWGKEGVVRTDKDGFLIQDRATLETIAAS